MRTLFKTTFDYCLVMILIQATAHKSLGLRYFGFPIPDTIAAQPLLHSSEQKRTTWWVANE